MQERLQKIIARAGIASRRKAEELIQQGLVTVNGRTVTELGSKADAGRDHIKVRGKLLSTGGERFYLLLNKPRECVSTTSDPEGRRTVLDLVGRFRSKVYPVGRLDYHSEGLLLLTNDGDFANHVLSAKSGIPKTYQVKVNGNLKFVDLETLRNGIRLDGRMTAPAKIRPLKPGNNPWFEVTLTEGRQNQIRRMFKSLGFLVEKLKRVRVGPLALGDLELGTFRELTPPEVQQLMKPQVSATPERSRPAERPAYKPAERRRQQAKAPARQRAKRPDRKPADEPARGPTAGPGRKPTNRPARKTERHSPPGTVTKSTQANNRPARKPANWSARKTADRPKSGPSVARDRGVKGRGAKGRGAKAGRSPKR